jgi:hypothetical protein
MSDQESAKSAKTENANIKEVTCDGYTFSVDLDAVDDVDNVELIDKIENQQNLKAIVDFLKNILGDKDYDKLKAYFVEKEGRLKLSKLGDIYEAIFKEFNPKG